MNILTALATRRSVGTVSDKPVDRNVIQQLLTYAAMAPNHKHTAPWRFQVWADAARFDLAAALAQEEPARVEFWREKVQRAPVIIAVWCAVGRTKQDVPAWEEEAAVAAACQNLLLAAHGLGLGAIWRTGKPTENPAVQALLPDFDATRGDKILAFMYVGYTV
jgi:nitroreductase